MAASASQHRSVRSFEEHTGELKLRIEAPTLAELFEGAATALADLMAGEAAAGPEVTEHIVLTSPDREALLVDWLNELILRAELRHVLLREMRVERLSDRELSATVRGTPVELLRNPVKAATLHELAIRASATGYEATVVLDV